MPLRPPGTSEVRGKRRGGAEANAVGIPVEYSQPRERGGRRRRWPVERVLGEVERGEAAEEVDDAAEAPVGEIQPQPLPRSQETPVQAEHDPPPLAPHLSGPAPFPSTLLAKSRRAARSSASHV